MLLATVDKNSVLKALFVVGFLGAGLMTSLYVPVFYRPLAQYAQKAIGEQFGASPIAPVYEEKIKALAQQMNIKQPIIIRKMNAQAMQVFGYHNLFVIFHRFMYLFPLVDTPFLFVSETFFEELTEQEQIFIIGHELTHAKEHHLRYFFLWYFLFSILLFASFWYLLIFPYLIPVLHKRLQSNYYGITIMCFLCTYIVCTTIMSCMYRRHIEWQADDHSLTLFSAHAGGIDYMNRIQKECGDIPAMALCGGLFTTHPSCAERRNYFKQHKNNLNSKGKINEI